MAARRLSLVRTAAAAGILALLLGPTPAAASRRDQKAADLFTEGVRLIKAGRYQEGALRMKAALERASEPTDEQGSQTRFLARRYDPYYWLGVAQMEMGLTEQAWESFETSLTIVPVGRREPLIKGWPEELADLTRRRAILQKRLEAPLVAAVPATPTATVAPEASPRAPEPTRPPERVAAAPPEPTRPAPEPAADPAPLDLLVARYRAFLADDVTGAAATPILAPRAAALEALRRTRPGADRLASALAAEERFFAASAAVPLRTAALRAALDAFGRQDWTRVAAHLARARSADPGAPQADILECAARATRYLLEGRRDPAELTAARASLAAWRARVGSGRPLPRILAPGVRLVLQGSSR